MPHGKPSRMHARRVPIDGNEENSFGPMTNGCVAILKTFTTPCLTE